MAFVIVNCSQKHIVLFSTGYAVFDLSPDDVISPIFPTEKEAQFWLDDFIANQEKNDFINQEQSS